MVFNPAVAGQSGSGETVSVAANGSPSPLEYNLYYVGEDEEIENKYVAGFSQELFTVTKGSMIVFNASELKPSITGEYSVYPSLSDTLPHPYYYICAKSNITIDVQMV